MCVCVIQMICVPFCIQIMKLTLLTRGEIEKLGLIQEWRQPTKELTQNNGSAVENAVSQDYSTQEI